VVRQIRSASPRISTFGSSKIVRCPGVHPSEGSNEGRGTLLVEGPVFSRTDEVFSHFYHHNWLDTDRSNWWVPTITCLRQWIECSFFDIVSEAGPALPDPGEKGAPGKGTSGWGIKSAIKKLLVTLGIRAVPKTPVMPRRPSCSSRTAGSTPGPASG
jgi:hypothetical protein